jgi:hypothetical protein
MKFFDDERGEDTTTYGKEFSPEDFGPKNESSGTEEN